MLALESVLGREQSLNREVIGSNCTSVSEVVLLLAKFARYNTGTYWLRLEMT